jgi:MoaA/NifB/PqqE/SkfB family radical SAM enzyme
MGAPKPWPTRWPEPALWPYETNREDADLFGEPDYDITDDPLEDPFHLPEERLTPNSVTWGVTHVCNLRCVHCYDAPASAGRRVDLSRTQALELVDRLAEMGVAFVAFSGGEPLWRADLFDLMARCRERGMGIALRSNATLVTPEKAQRLAELNLSVVGVSLDGATAVSHDQMRGKGSFAKTINGIQLLQAAGIRINVEVVLTQRNAADCQRFVALAEELGVDELNFSAIAPQGRARQLSQERLDHALWRKVTAVLYEASLTAAVAVSPSCALTGPCWACLEPNITCDGWVTACYLSDRKLFSLLETPPAQARAYLRQLRARTVNICGRNDWLRPPAASWHNEELAGSGRRPEPILLRDIVMAA